MRHLVYCQCWEEGLYKKTKKHKNLFPKSTLATVTQALKIFLSPEPMPPLERQSKKLLEMCLEINVQGCLKQQYRKRFFFWKKKKSNRRKLLNKSCTPLVWCIMQSLKIILEKHLSRWENSPDALSGERGRLHDNVQMAVVQKVPGTNLHTQAHRALDRQESLCLQWLLLGGAKYEDFWGGSFHVLGRF